MEKCLDFYINEVKSIFIKVETNFAEDSVHEFFLQIRELLYMD